MAEKVTMMKLKVDLECEKCYKKVKKLLAKYPQIRDQKFDEKQNVVFITVVCCSPEKMRDKLCCKGGGSIKSIEIVEQPKPKPPEADKKKEPEKTKPKPAEDAKPKPVPEPDKKKDPEKAKPKPAEDAKPKQDGPKKEGEKPKDGPEKSKDKPPEPKPTPPQVKPPDPVPAPPPVAVPVGICCVPCYEGRPGGPCMNGFVGPPLCYDGYYGRPVYDSYGGGRPYYVSRCDQYFSEENPSGCTVM